ncbi:hypothetical protein [Bradyrhizobium sp. AUGA SZCCT0160]|uniref:hypothetical protein n=1 Tax=Bradyrhizobium sp. AUGA SZCCT0160 TaxID=2807662 RepID=UPI001BABE17D|nr:hypothetical protein [Bradyrhizobium sp. AUGA SZCCT0160]MBR1189732.1 hypothetical protein [Bradyrhizobium sp. AUGA SZCCT0160]
MSNALHATPAARPGENFVAIHGAEQAVASVPPPLTFIMPPRLPPPLPKRPAQNVIARHWRGELSLPRSYWINYVVLGTSFGLASAVLGAAINPSVGEQPVRWLISHGLTWIAIILFTIWGAIGVWRAATAYRQTGKRFWGTAAKATMALGAFHLVYSVYYVAIPQGLGIYEIAAGDARLASHQFKVLNNGTMLDFSGGISFGTAKEFETILKALDNVCTVRLNSNGGRVAEAQKISDLIKARGLSTYVTHQCASACTIMFLGGKQRHLHANAAFAERANSAGPSGMWFPEQSELLRERVVTSIFNPQPPKPVATAAPAPSAPASRSVPVLPKTQAAYQGAPL